MNTYSQNDEQDVFLKLMPEAEGRFLDIGAYNLEELSNTRALLERGWKGVYVEPDPLNLAKMIAQAEPFGDRVMIVMAAILATTQCALTRLRMDKTAGRGWASTLFPDLISVGEERATAVCVPTLPVEMLYDFAPFQFVSIDAEGADLQILGKIDLRLIKCDVCCIEANQSVREQARKLFDGHGFEVVYETRQNVIAKRRT